MSVKKPLVVEPYVKVGELHFGITTKQECINLLGPPFEEFRRRKCTDANLEYDFGWVVVDSNIDNLVELVFRNNTTFFIEDIKVTWDQVFLKTICEHDGNPFFGRSLIILPRLGIAIEEPNSSEEFFIRTINAFQRPFLPAFLKGAIPYNI